MTLKWADKQTCIAYLVSLVVIVYMKFVVPSYLSLLEIFDRQPARQVASSIFCLALFLGPWRKQNVFMSA